MSICVWIHCHENEFTEENHSKGEVSVEIKIELNFEFFFSMKIRRNYYYWKININNFMNGFVCAHSMFHECDENNWQNAIQG